MNNTILYIECGVTTRTKINSGIQRVVRSITHEINHIASQMGYEPVALCFFGGDFHINIGAETSAYEVQTPQWIHILATLDRKMQRLWRFGIYSWLRLHLKPLVKRWSHKWESKGIELEPISPDGKSTILLLLDSNWDNDMWHKVDAFRQAGGRVCAVLYDLIPFTHPDTVADETRIAHTSWWLKAPEHIDLIMCISKSVREEFLDWQNRMCLPSTLSEEQVGYFYLGAELTITDPVIKLLSSTEPYFLMVGSLEPRKNHKTVLDAFDRLWQQGKKLRLAVVGAYGWKSEVLLSRIQEHPHLNEKLFLIRDATDRDLVALYKGAEALIIASKAEGFGLPIIESQQMNCKVICSDIPVFREVAGANASYFDAMDDESLARLVLAHVKVQESMDETRPECLSWRKSAAQLLLGLGRIARHASKINRT